MSFVSYHVKGFRRADHKSNVSIIVDVDEKHLPEDSPHSVAERIAGPEYCFHACYNINQPVPDGVKGRLFHSDEELHAAVPSMAPQPRRRTAR